MCDTSNVLVSTMRVLNSSGADWSNAFSITYRNYKLQPSLTTAMHVSVLRMHVVCMLLLLLVHTREALRQTHTKLCVCALQPPLLRTSLARLVTIIFRN
jgi:hypothetical protein